MEENGSDEQWITVNELCDRFSLTRYKSNLRPGFLEQTSSTHLGGFSLCGPEGLNSADGCHHPSDPKNGADIFW